MILRDLTPDPPTDEPMLLDGQPAITDRWLKFTPDSRWLVTAAADNSIRLWNLRIDELIDLAKRTAGRELRPSERERLRLDSLVAPDK